LEAESNDEETNHESNDEETNQLEANDPHAALDREQLQDPTIEGLVHEVLNMPQEPHGKNNIFTFYLHHF
jgi:hypothetical protein